jgi:hypothetical protein
MSLMVWSGTRVPCTPGFGVDGLKNVDAKPYSVALLVGGSRAFPTTRITTL